MVHFRVLFSLLGLCLALPDLDCDEGECALSLRQLRGQKFESAISDHAGPLQWEGVCFTPRLNLNPISALCLFCAGPVTDEEDRLD